DSEPATIRDTPTTRHTHTRHTPTTTRDMATIRDMCIRGMDTTPSAITGEADDMFGQRTTEVGMDMAGTGGAAIPIATLLTARVASPTVTSSNGGGRSSERRGPSPQARR